MKKRLRFGLGLLIVLLTVAVIADYLAKHSYLLTQLAHTSPAVILWVLLLYGAILAVLVLILAMSLRICRTIVPISDNILLNIYSLFVNFFVIGQSGPGVRAVYLKRNYKLAVRKYIYVTVLYYICYSLISGLMLLIGGTLPWWLVILSVLVAGGAATLAVRWYTRRNSMSGHGLNLSVSSLAYLFLATLLQMILQTILYLVELHAVGAHVALKQTIAYTGVANFALFVGLTPGAIGIRESFLVFSERLHHISSAHIVAANIIDRAVYLVFLAILLLVIIIFHASNKFSTKEEKHIDH